MEQTYTKHEEERYMDSTVVVTPPFDVGEGAIDAPELDENTAQEYAEKIAKNYLVKVPETAPGYCIDGRECSHCKNGEDSEPGPKCAGGPLITSYAAALTTQWFEPNDSRGHEGRMQLIAQQLTDGKVVLGCHGDSASEKVSFMHGKTGCGANDRLPTILQNVGKYPEAISGASELILNETDTYRPERAQAVVETAVKNPVEG